jgi:hypothetical protein
MKSINWKNGLHYTLMLLFVATACGDEARVSSVEVGPAPGLLTVEVTSPNTDDGAVSIALRGEGISSPAAANPENHLIALEVAPGSEEVRVAVLGYGVSGTLVQFRVPDVNRLDAYSVDLIEVADEANRPREDLTGYSVRVVSPEGAAR